MVQVTPHCWLGGRKGIRPVENMGGWWRWALVSLDGVVPSQMVVVSLCLPLLMFPCTIKSRSCLLAPAHPGGQGKRAVKWLWFVVCGGVVCLLLCCCCGVGEPVSSAGGGGWSAGCYCVVVV